MSGDQTLSGSGPSPATRPAAETDPAPARRLASKAATIPRQPGVYLFKDADGTVLYVGKALDLSKRVGSYFRSAGPQTVKTRVLMARAADLDYVVTATEKEALLLEASLIKKHRPRYNVVLRDDKNYPAIRIDLRDPYPRLEIVRKLRKDGALYFGPYASAYAVRETLKLLNRLFPLRQCKSKRLHTRDRPCLNYSLGHCLGACAGKVTQEQYRAMVDELVLFLEGKTNRLQRQLKEYMEQAAEALEFERAAVYRDRLRAVAATLEKQHVVSSRFLDQDVLGIYQPERDAAAAAAAISHPSEEIPSAATESGSFEVEQPATTELDSAEAMPSPATKPSPGRSSGGVIVVLLVRQGALVGQYLFDLKEAQGEPGELLAAFIRQYYGRERALPDEVLVPQPVDDQDLLEEWLSELKGKRLRIWPASRGDRRHLLELAARNARERFASRQRWRRSERHILERLQEVLRLPRFPGMMACVDISNIQGRYAVGAVVVFSNGRPKKDFYRRFRVETATEPDDPAMMAEVVERFLEHEPEVAASLDLLVVDGGKGQLNRIVRLLESQGMGKRLPAIGIAKEREADRGSQGRGLYEKIYLHGRKNPLFLTPYPELLNLLKRLRDEAHRFAISYYQKRHRRELLGSVLDTVPGVGPKRRQALLQHFGSLEAIERASLEDLQTAPAMYDKLARRLFEFFRTEPADPESDP